MQKKEPKLYPKNRSISAIGIIVPVEWDVEGNPIRVALSTNDEAEYLIDRRSGKGREVAKLLREQVQVEGILNEEGTIIIKCYSRFDNGFSDPKTHRSTDIIDIFFQSKKN